MIALDVLNSYLKIKLKKYKKYNLHYLFIIFDNITFLFYMRIINIILVRRIQ